MNSQHQEQETVWQGLGNRPNTTESNSKYPILKDKQTYKKSKPFPEPSELCRIRINGDIKKYAWEYAERLVRIKAAEFIEWVR